MKKIKSFVKSFGLIFLYLIFEEIIALLSTCNNSLLYKNIVLIVGSLVVTVVFISFFNKDIFKDFKDFKKNHKDYIPRSLKYWAIGYVITFVLNIIISVLINGIAPNEEANRLMITSFPIYMALSVCLTAPICEEILFRLNFKSIFHKRLVYILFTGILFGAAHLIVSENLMDLVYILPYSALGISFSAAYYDTKNIFTSIFIHIFHNTVNFLLLITIL